MKDSRKHSRYGILSFTTFILFLLFSMYIVYTDLAKYVFTSTDNIIPANITSVYIQTSMLLIISIIGTLFGIVGVLEKDKRKVFSVIGLVLNGFITATFAISTLLAFINN